MKEYKHCSVEDFVQDFRFRSWVRNPTAEEDVIWQNWIRENNYQQRVIEEARAIVLAIHPVHRENMSDKEVQNEIQNILASLDEDDNEAKAKESIPRKEISFLSWAKIAASVSIILVSGWYGIDSLRVVEKIGPPIPLVSEDIYMIERVNKSVDPLLISLPDNSSVLLSQNSLIRYPVRFAGDSRNVFFEGTAFFEVTKDPEKPFYVNAGQIVAKVLGTSFKISTDPISKQIRVIVKSGTVSIYSKGTDSKVTESIDDLDNQPHTILTKNEQFVSNGNVSKIQHTRLDSLSVGQLKVPDTFLKFAATPAAEVFEMLAKVYGVIINYENAQISGCSLTASFTDEPFALKLDLICRSIGVKYEMVNDQTTITGTGCKN